jgi:hypothetical protein
MRAGPSNYPLKAEDRSSRKNHPAATNATHRPTTRSDRVTVSVARNISVFMRTNPRMTNFVPCIWLRHNALPGSVLINSEVGCSTNSRKADVASDKHCEHLAPPFRFIGCKRLMRKAPRHRKDFWSTSQAGRPACRGRRRKKAPAHGGRPGK